MQTNDLLKIHEQLLRAAAGEISFLNAIDTMTQAFGAAAGVVFELNRKTGEISNWASRTLETSDDGYSQYINSINPRMRYSMRHAAGHIAYEHKFIDQSGMEKNEFYDWLKRDHGLGYFLGSRLYDEGDTSVFHSIEFSKKHGHPGQAEIDSFTRTSRALGNAWRCASLVAGPVPTGHFKAWVPDHLPWSIFALSSVGKVLDMNSQARALVERRDVVSIWDEILVPSHRSSLAEFKRGIAAAINGHGFDLLLPGGEKSKKYIVKLVPVKTLEFSSPVPLAILVYLWDPMRTRQNIDQSLRILWGLSHAESALVMQLSYGLSLTLAAEALGVSRHTARNQLQNIFAKTNTNRQAELLAHILGIIDHK